MPVQRKHNNPSDWRNFIPGTIVYRVERFAELFLRVFLFICIPKKGKRTTHTCVESFAPILVTHTHARTHELTIVRSHTTARQRREREISRLLFPWQFFNGTIDLQRTHFRNVPAVILYWSARRTVQPLGGWFAHRANKLENRERKRELSVSRELLHRKGE